MTEPRLVWLDIETTGLDPFYDRILEIGFVITDLNLVAIEDYSVLIWEPMFADEVENAPDLVIKMHTDNQLLKSCQIVGKTQEGAFTNLMHFLDGHDIKGKTEPICGSSVHFDRNFLRAHPLYQKIDDRFSHRNIDVSTLKELCRRFNPEIIEMVEKIIPRGEHRAISDCWDTIYEFSQYRDYFLKIDPRTVSFENYGR